MSKPPADPPSQDTDPSHDIEVLLARAERGSLQPDEQKFLVHALHQRVEFHQSIVQSSGPVPHPEIFEQYSEPVQERILAMAEKEQEHTHAIRKEGLTGAITCDRRGQHYGLAVALAGLLAATVIAFESPTAAAVIGSFDLLGLVAVFVYPRFLKHRAEKREAERPAEDEEN